MSSGSPPRAAQRRRAPGRHRHRDSAAVDFATMMALEPHGTDVWVGAGPRYPWGGLYGGQIVAQALRAGTFTIEDRYRVHSLHAYFIRLGDHTEPIRFEVDRVRNGRSFCTRRITARQSVGVILNMTASYQVDEPDRRCRPRSCRHCRRPRSWPRRAGARSSTGACRRGARDWWPGGCAWPKRSVTTRRSRRARWPICPTTSPPSDRRGRSPRPDLRVRRAHELAWCEPRPRVHGVTAPTSPR